MVLTYGSSAAFHCRTCGYSAVNHCRTYGHSAVNHCRVTADFLQNAMTTPAVGIQ